MNIFYYSILLIVLLLLSFISFFHDNIFSYSESKNVTYKFEPYLRINGTDFYDLENKNQLQLEEFSLATWFRTKQNNFNEPAHIVNKGGFNNDKFGKNMNYGVWMNIDGTITGGFESQSGENFEILSQKKYNDGKWHYVIVSYSSTVLRMYIDGQQIGIIQINEKPDITGNQPVRLGANSLDLDKFFKGEIDEVRIWNRGLTVNEINEIYDNKDFNFTGQVEYLNFGKNTMNSSSEIINNNSNITNGTKDIQTTTKPPAVVFVILLSEDTLEKIQTTTKPPIVETLSPNQAITQVPSSNNPSFIDNAIHWIDNAKASFIINTNN